MLLMHRSASILSAALVLAASLHAADTRSAERNAAPPDAQLSDLAWMEGRWVGKGFGADLEETYSAPAGGQMPGHFRVVRDGKPQFYELVMIAQVGSSIEYRVRHFNPDLTAWEEKDNVVRFPLVALEKDVWFFDGLTIRRTGRDSADHIVRIKHKDGTENEAVLRYTRARP